MATQQKVLLNMTAQTIGKFLSIFSSLVIVKIITSFGRDFYGDYVTAYEFLAFFGIMADAGLFNIAVREMSRAKEKTEFFLSNILSMRLILILGVILIAGISAQLVPTYSPLVKHGIWITGLSMGLTIIAGTLSSVLQSRMKIQYFSGSLVLGKLLLAGLIFFIAQETNLFPHKFYALLWAGVVSNLVFCSLVLFFVSKEVRIRLGFDFEWWKHTLRISLPYGLALVLQTLYLRIDILIISLLLGSSAVGIYGASTRILESFLILGVFFGQAILPKLSTEEGESTNTKFTQTVQWGIEILSFFAFPIILYATRFSSEIILIISSPEFLTHDGITGSDTLLTVLIFTIFFAYLNQLFSFALVAKNRQFYLLWINAGALALNAVLNFYFLLPYGVIAAAISTLICEIVVFVSLSKTIGKYFDGIQCWKNMGIIAFGNLIIFIQIYLTPLQENFTLAAAIGSLSYLILFWFFRHRFFPKTNIIS